MLVPPTKPIMRYPLQAQELLCRGAGGGCTKPMHDLGSYGAAVANAYCASFMNQHHPESRYALTSHYTAEPQPE